MDTHFYVVGVEAVTTDQISNTINNIILCQFLREVNKNNTVDKEPGFIEVN